jgi:general secretion pathway protein K
MNVRHRSSAAASGQDGFVIVPVLWILMMLASFAGIVSVYLSNSATALALADDRLKSGALVSASLELTAYKLTSMAKQSRPPSGSLVFRLDQAALSIRYSSEASRINLNLAPKEILSNFFQVLGAQPKDAEQYADRIIGWRAPPPDDSLESESSLYRAAGERYLPRGAPFPTVDELWLVLGLPSALVERALPYVTVFGGRPEIDVFEAAPEVVAAIPGMTPATLAMFLKERDALPRDAASIAQYFGSKPSMASGQGSDAVRVRTDIVFDNGRRAGAEVVILLLGGSDPYRILSWQDDAENFARSELIGRRSQ